MKNANRKSALSSKGLCLLNVAKHATWLLNGGTVGPSGKTALEYNNIWLREAVVVGLPALVLDLGALGAALRANDEAKILAAARDLHAAVVADPRWGEKLEASLEA